jgi:hypothetical protein
LRSRNGLPLRDEALHRAAPSPEDRGTVPISDKGAFILERILGALFSTLFFLAISGTVVRQL